LTRFFIEKYSREFGKEINTISSYALELLLEYQFPGNIRELENIIERSIVLEQSNIILPENLVLTGSIGTADYIGDDLDIPPDGIDLNDEVAKLERRLIEKALEKAGGSKTKTAELLHVSSDSLRYRIEKLGIQ
jgi:two-component system response regulator PilR (NtrC family)